MTSHMMTLTFACVLALTLSNVQGQIFTRGKTCSEPETVQNFDIARYMGKWFAYEEFPFRETDSRCVIANYTLREDNTVRVVNVAVVPFFVGEAPCPLFRNVVVDGYAFIPEGGVASKLKVDFPRGRTPGEPGDYWVLDTDYDNYTVVYSCQMTITDDFQMGKTESTWVLTRDKGVKPANLDAIHDMLTKNDIDIKNFQVVNQEGCPEWDGQE